MFLLLYLPDPLAISHSKSGRFPNTTCRPHSTPSGLVADPNVLCAHLHRHFSVVFLAQFCIPLHPNKNLLVVSTDYTKCRLPHISLPIRVPFSLFSFPPSIVIPSLLKFISSVSAPGLFLICLTKSRTFLLLYSVPIQCILHPKLNLRQFDVPRKRKTPGHEEVHLVFCAPIANHSNLFAVKYSRE